MGLVKFYPAKNFTYTIISFPATFKHVISTVYIYILLIDKLFNVVSLQSSFAMMMVVIYANTLHMIVAEISHPSQEG
jgi:hypothetical protein